MDAIVVKPKDEPTQALAVQHASPIMALADKLAEGKITAEQMEKMLDVQIKWEKNEAEKAFHAAMAEFHKDAPAIMKAKEGHNCKYAGLSDIVAAVAPKLSDQGLSHTWRTESLEAGIQVICKITHVLGHSESTSMSAGLDKSGSKNDVQALGSTVTYLQRYTLKAALGLAEGDQGNDGAGAGDNLQFIDPPNELQWECIDAIIDKLPKDEGKIDRDRLAKWFLASKGAYPTTKTMVGQAAEHVVQQSPKNIYITQG